MSSVDIQRRVSVVFVLGGPGAGKGTQCANIVRDFDFVHLSAGDLLRAEQATPGSQYGEMIAQMIRDGQIVPAEVTINLLRRAMEQSTCDRFLIDGFPRNEDNRATWDRIMPDFADTKFLMFMDCPEAEMTARILRRSADSGRIDDNIESLRKRFQTYEQSTRPVIEYFEAKGLVRKVDATREVSQVYTDVNDLLVKEFGTSALRSTA